MPVISEEKLRKFFSMNSITKLNDNANLSTNNSSDTGSIVANGQNESGYHHHHDSHLNTLICTNMSKLNKINAMTNSIVRKGYLKYKTDRRSEGKWGYFLVRKVTNSRTNHDCKYYLECYKDFQMKKFKLLIELDNVKQIVKENETTIYLSSNNHGFYIDANEINNASLWLNELCLYCKLNNNNNNNSNNNSNIHISNNFNNNNINTNNNESPSIIHNGNYQNIKPSTTPATPKTPTKMTFPLSKNAIAASVAESIGSYDTLMDNKSFSKSTASTTSNKKFIENYNNQSNYNLNKPKISVTRDVSNEISDNYLRLNDCLSGSNNSYTTKQQQQQPLKIKRNKNYKLQLPKITIDSATIATPSYNSKSQSNLSNSISLQSILIDNNNNNHNNTNANKTVETPTSNSYPTRYNTLSTTHSIYDESVDYLPLSALSNELASSYHSINDNNHKKENKSFLYPRFDRLSTSTSEHSDYANHSPIDTSNLFFEHLDTNSSTFSDDNSSYKLANNDHELKYVPLVLVSDHHATTTTTTNDNSGYYMDISSSKSSYENIKSNGKNYDNFRLSLSTDSDTNYYPGYSMIDSLKTEALHNTMSQNRHLQLV